MEFEIDKWYTHSDGAFVCYQGGSEGYGFDTRGDWKIGYDWCFKLSSDSWKVANINTVKELLLEYANKMYPKGTNHSGYTYSNKSTEFPYTESNSPTDFSYEVTKPLHIKFGLEIFADSIGCIFSKGVWSAREQDYNKNIFKVGRWYVHENGALVCHQIDHAGYGFDGFGKWTVGNNWSTSTFSEDWSPALDLTVQEALLEYARKHYPMGTMHTGHREASINTEFPFEKKAGNYVLDFKFKVIGPMLISNSPVPNVIHSQGASGYIYKNGVWADKEPHNVPVDFNDSLGTITLKGCPDSSISANEYYYPSKSYVDDLPSVYTDSKLMIATKSKSKLLDFKSVNLTKISINK